MKAFPFSVMTYDPNHPDSPRYTTTWHEGMGLRDYFAAKAMTGGMWVATTDGNTYDRDARECYKIADAMMKARGIPNE
ncbi:MAG TPA: hypothetical protein VLA24_17195 [Pseudomonadales bacterium]|nr:hypothetical protein [Pseudomonadales bacterium]